MRKKVLFLLLILFSFSASGIAAELYDPVTVWLTLDDDPTSTITIHWLSLKKEPMRILAYREKGEKKWQTTSYKSHELPRRFPYLANSKILTGLKSDTEYEFTFGQDSIAYSFRTAQKRLKRPVTFISGGDIHHDDTKTLEKMHKHIPCLSPDFIVLGGDIAYSAPKFTFFQEDFRRWLDFFLLAKKYFRTKEGRLIPLVAAIGNHEVIGRYHQSLQKAPYFSLFFLSSARTKTHYHLLFGNYMSLTVLDSGHTQHVPGEQTTWLETTLKTYAHIPHRFAVYHVPAWPSVRKMDTKISPAIRYNWVPLFEKYGVQIAFEHHDHGYKRTHPLKEGKIDPAGVVYIGDGAWGIKEPRSPKTKEEKWYLGKRGAVQHFLYVTIDSKGRTVKAIDSTGGIYDTYRQTH